MNLAFLRIVRIARLMRAFRVLRSIRELYLLMNGVLSSMKAMFFGSVLLFTMLVGFAIIMVEWVHPYNSEILYGSCGEECSQAFKSVRYSVITLFKQLIAGGSWIISFSLFEKEPWLIVLLMITTLTISLGIINLILTVIVERAADAKEKDIQEMARQKCQNQAEAKDELLKLCEYMDQDESGKLTLNDLLTAYSHSHDFRNLMTVMDLQESELQALFEIADRDGSGTVAYDEFCDELLQIKAQDQRMCLAMLRFSVLELRHLVEFDLGRQVHSILAEARVHSSQLTCIEHKIEQLLTPQQIVKSTQTFESKKAVQSATLCAMSFGHSRLQESLVEERPSLPSVGPPKHAPAWNGLDELRDEVQNLLDVEEYLVQKVEMQVDASMAKVISAFHNLINKESAAQPDEIKMIDAWLVKHKLGECTSEFSSILRTDGFQRSDIPIEEGKMRKHQQLLSRLKALLPQLLRLSAGDFYANASLELDTANDETKTDQALVLETGHAVCGSLPCL